MCIGKGFLTTGPPGKSRVLFVIEVWFIYNVVFQVYSKVTQFHIRVCVCVCVLVVQLCPNLATPWTVARQAPQSVRFPRPEYWSGLPLPPPGIEPRPPALQADSLLSEPPGTSSFIYMYNFIYI